MRLGRRRRARAREATPAPTDPYDRALSDLVDELRLHHPVVGDLRNFMRSPSKSSTSTGGIQAWKPPTGVRRWLW